MKLVRSYLLFTPLLYRILMLVVLPVAVWIFAIFFCVDAIIGTIMSAMIVCCVEIIADYWVFGGICTKEFPGLEFLKSSVRGRKIFRSAVTGDCVRKLIWSLVLVAGPTILMILSGDREYAGIGPVMQPIASLASGAACLQHDTALSVYRPASDQFCSEHVDGLYFRDGRDSAGSGGSCLVSGGNAFDRGGSFHPC